GHVGRRRACRRGVGLVCGHVGHEISMLLLVVVWREAEGTGVAGVAVMSTPAWTSASVNAVQPSSAHFTRAGYFETPANATPSPISSSSPGSAPLLVS